LNGETLESNLWFIRETETEISVDRRFSDGKFLGLKFKRIEEPQAYWFKPNKPFEILNDIDETEMFKNGYRKTYDCGQLVFEKENFGN
jgi:hypothetical protein